MNRKVTVIGGAGFIGSHLVKALVEQGFRVTVIDNLSSGKKSNIKDLSIDLRVYDITGDPKKIAAIIKGSACVFHLAALTSVQESLESPTLYNLVNVLGTANVLEACRLAKVDQVVFSSTSAVYGDNTLFPTNESVPTDPISTYALTKKIGENYCQLYSSIYEIKTTCLRYFNVYGTNTNPNSSYKSVIPIFLEKSKAGESLPIVNDGEQRRDFIHVSDVVNANIASIDSTKYHRVINIGSGDNISVNQIAKIIGGKTVNVGFRLEPKTSLSDITAAKKYLDWEPRIKLEDWLKDQTSLQTQSVHQS
jgi:UDP-glucose 4-epimerase